MSKNKPVKMVLWSCEKWTVEKCEGEYPCQVLAPRIAKLYKRSCILGKKGNWKVVPTSKLTV